MSYLLHCVLLGASILALAPVASADLTLRYIEHSRTPVAQAGSEDGIEAAEQQPTLSVGQSTEHIYYVRGDLRRQDFSGVHVFESGVDGSAHLLHDTVRYHVQDCHNRRAFWVDPQSRVFLRYRDQPDGQIRKLWERSRRRPPTLRVEIEVRDTGERALIAGLEARRILITRRETRLAPARNHRPEWPSRVLEEVRRDAWYVELPEWPACGDPPDALALVPGEGLALAGSPGEVESFELDIRRDGVERLTGYPVRYVETTRSVIRLGDGTTHEQERTVERELLQLSREPLDAALFAEPHGFRRLRWHDVFRMAIGAKR